MANNRHVGSWKCSTLPKTALWEQLLVGLVTLQQVGSILVVGTFCSTLYIHILSTARSQEAQEASFCTELEFPG